MLGAKRGSRRQLHARARPVLVPRPGPGHGPGLPGSIHVPAARPVTAHSTPGRPCRPREATPARAGRERDLGAPGASSLTQGTPGVLRRLGRGAARRTGLESGASSPRSAHPRGAPGATAKKATRKVQNDFRANCPPGGLSSGGRDVARGRGLVVWWAGLGGVVGGAA